MESSMKSVSIIKHYLKRKFKSSSKSCLKCPFFGKIDNHNVESENMITLEAEKLRVIQFSPFKYLKYASNEKIIVLEKYFGLLTPKMAFGLFKAFI